MTTLTIHYPSNQHSDPIKVTEIKWAEPNTVSVIDGLGVLRTFNRLPYTLTTWPDNQKELFGER